MFKDIIANDVENVFFNTKEFADTALINGRQIDIVLDNQHLSHNSNIQELEGLEGDIFYYVSKKAWLDTFGELPEAFDAQNFNGRACSVTKTGERNGVLEITLAYR